MQFPNYGIIPVGAVLAGVLATTLGLRLKLWITARCLALPSFVLLAEPIQRPSGSTDPSAPR